MLNSSRNFSCILGNKYDDVMTAGNKMSAPRARRIAASFRLICLNSRMKKSVLAEIEIQPTGLSLAQIVAGFQCHY